MKQLKHIKLFKVTDQWPWLVMILLTISLLMTPSQAFAKGQTLTNLVDLQKAIHVDLTNRETNFTLYYTGDTTQMIENLTTVFEQAKQTDDYLNRSLTSWGYNVAGTTIKATLEFTVGYLTTKEQEDYIDEKVKALVPTLITSDMSDVAKEKALHDWLINHVSYDFTLNQRTAYTALTTGKTVCTGYAMLMYKMLNLAGIKSYIIAGNLSETSSSIPNAEWENHVWNLVQIDNQWYHVDVTNDWNNPDSHMFFNKGSAFMQEKGFAWSEDQLIRPVKSKLPPTNPSNEPVNAESPENSGEIIDPQLSKVSIGLNLSERVLKIIGLIETIVTMFAKWIYTIIQQLSLLIRDLIQT